MGSITMSIGIPVSIVVAVILGSVGALALCSKAVGEVCKVLPMLPEVGQGLE